MRQPLGRLEKIELRDIWRSEAQDFTPWLASPANLALLGEALGIELEIEAQERNVGPFKADILCKDMLDGSWVLIENQLEKTDHTHLGQLLTSQRVCRRLPLSGLPPSSPMSTGQRWIG
jgi:hypothetical protein